MVQKLTHFNRIHFKFLVGFSLLHLGIISIEPLRKYRGSNPPVFFDFALRAVCLIKIRDLRSLTMLREALHYAFDEFIFLKFLN